MPTRAIVENIFTMTLATATVLGLYGMGAGGWAACGLLWLSNLNTPRRKE